MPRKLTIDLIIETQSPLEKCEEYQREMLASFVARWQDWGWAVTAQQVHAEQYPARQTQQERLDEAANNISDAASILVEVRRRLEAWQGGLARSNLGKSDKIKEIAAEIIVLERAIHNCEAAKGTIWAIELPRAFGG